MNHLMHHILLLLQLQVQPGNDFRVDWLDPAETAKNESQLPLLIFPLARTASPRFFWVGTRAVKDAKRQEEDRPDIEHIVRAHNLES